MYFLELFRNKICFCFQEMTIPWCLRRAELVFKCVKGKHNFVFNNYLYFFLPNTQNRVTQEKKCKCYSSSGASVKWFIKQIFHSRHFLLILSQTQRFSPLQIQDILILFIFCSDYSLFFIVFYSLKKQSHMFSLR